MDSANNGIQSGHGLILVQLCKFQKDGSQLRRDCDVSNGVPVIAKVSLSTCRRRVNESVAAQTKRSD